MLTIMVAPGRGATWVVGDGDWEVPENWSPQAVPDGSSESVTISATLDSSNVTLNSNKTIGDLSITAGDRLKLSPGARLQIDGTSFSNQGVVELLANAGQFSELTINADVSYSGTGKLRFADENSLTTLELLTGATLTIPGQSNLTIEGPAAGAGRGGIEGGAIVVANQGELVFDDLAFFSVDTPITNEGDIVVVGVNGGQVNFDSTTLNQQTGIGSLNGSDDATVQLTNVDVLGGILTALDNSTMRLNGGSYDDVTFIRVELATGMVVLRDRAQFLAIGQQSTLAGTAALQMDGTVRMFGTLETASGATIAAGVNGKLQSETLRLTGTGALTISTPVDITGSLTLSRNGTTNFGSSPISLQGQLVVDGGTASFGAQQIALDSLRQDAILASNGADLQFFGTDLVRVGIQATGGSTLRLTGGSVNDVVIEGGTTNVQGTVTVNNEGLEWDERITMSAGSKLRANGTGVELLGSGEIEFLDAMGQVVPELDTQTDFDQFVLPENETLVLSGKRGRIGGAGPERSTLRVEGALVVSAEQLDVEVSEIQQGATATVVGGSVLRLEGLLNQQPSGGSFAAMGDGETPGGTLWVDAGGQVVMANGSSIRGGTIKTTGDGVVAVEFLQTSGGFGTLEGVNNQGLVRVSAQADFGLRGNIDNSGMIELGAGATSSFHTTDVVVYGEVELTGDGTMAMTGIGSGRFLAQPGSGGEASRFINSNTILASQRLQFGTSAAQAMAITNRGMIEAEDDLEFYLPVGEQLVNQGQVHLTTAVSRILFRTANSVIRNTGDIALDDPGSRIIVGDYIQDRGTTSGMGTIQGNFVLNGGTMRFGGTLIGGLTSSAGVIEIGDPVGRFQLSTDFVQSASTTLKFDIGGTTAESEYDVFDILGFFGTLGGPLEVGLIDLGGGLFLPDGTDTFQVLQTLNSVSGAFTNVANGARVTTGDGLGSFVVNYGLTSPFGFNNVVLSDFLFDPTADFDDDGDVDATDVATWMAAFGLDGGGDTDGDGDSDGADFLTIQRQFGISPSPIAAAAVPEPATAALLFFCSVLLTVWRQPSLA